MPSGCGYLIAPRCFYHPEIRQVIVTCSSDPRVIGDNTGNGTEQVTASHRRKEQSAGRGK